MHQGGEIGAMQKSNENPAINKGRDGSSRGSKDINRSMMQTLSKDVEGCIKPSKYALQNRCGSSAINKDWRHQGIEIRAMQKSYEILSINKEGERHQDASRYAEELRKRCYQNR